MFTQSVSLITVICLRLGGFFVKAQGTRDKAQGTRHKKGTRCKEPKAKENPRKEGY